MEFTPYTLPLIVATGIALGLAGFVLKRRQVPGRVTFALLMLAVALWSAGYALEISATDFATKVFWAKFQYLGITAIPLLWLRFVVHYVGESGSISPGRFALLAIGPVVTVAMVWFNERLGLIWADITVDNSLGFRMLDFHYGPGLWAYAGYSYLLLLIGALVLFRAIVRLPRLGARQGAVVLFAALAPWAGNAMYLTNTNPFPLLDLTPFSFVLTGLAVAWGMGQFQFMGTVPVAHRAIIEGMQSGVIALDTAHNIVEINPAAERMFDLRADKIVGRSAQQVFADRPEVIEWVTSARETTIRGRLESHGVGREFDIRTMLLYDRRRHAGRLITFHDISKLARAEREAEEAKNVAEAASRAKSEFLANVSHEVRTPLNAIMGMTDLALEGELDAKQREYLEVARSSADSLLSIINDILDFSKIEVRKVTLDSVAFDLRKLIEETLKMLAVTAAGKPLKLHGVVAEEVPHVFAGDPLRLRQVLSNLVSNAIKFTDEGEVRVEVRLDPEAGLDDGLCRLGFTVTDTGIGISAADRQHIFDSFAQADASTTRIYGGTGLGLAIASHLVGLMHGSLDVESTLGEGSTFRFSALLARSDEAAVPTSAERRSAKAGSYAEVQLEMGGGATAPGTPAAASPLRGQGTQQRLVQSNKQPEQAAGGGLRVLVADDNRINQRMASALLESRGHRAVIVSDGQEAVEAIAEHEFDVVLMDVQMPRVDGVEATRSVRSGEHWSGKHVPIIAITAHAMAGDRERFLEAGMDAYVPKPLDAELLFRTIGEVLAARPSSTPAAPTAAGPAPEAPTSEGPIPVGVEEPRAGVASQGSGAAASQGPDDADPDVGGADQNESEPVDKDAALEKLGGDEELFVEIIGLYLDDAPKVWVGLQAAAAAGDAEGVWKAAHRLKGSVGSLSAMPTFEAARDLETAGRAGTIDSELIAELEAEMGRLEKALRELQQQAAS